MQLEINKYKVNIREIQWFLYNQRRILHKLRFRNPKRMDKEKNLSWWNNGHVFYFLSKRQTTVDTKLWNELTFKARRSFSKECPIKIASCGRRSIKHFWTSSNVAVTFSSVFFVMPLNLHKKKGETQVSIYTLNLKVLKDFP